MKKKPGILMRLNDERNGCDEEGGGCSKCERIKWRRCSQFRVFERCGECQWKTHVISYVILLLFY